MRGTANTVRRTAEVSTGHAGRPRAASARARVLVPGQAVAVAYAAGDLDGTVSRLTAGEGQ